jgi:hypothetical protein
MHGSMDIKKVIIIIIIIIIITIIIISKSYTCNNWVQEPTKKHLDSTSATNRKKHKFRKLQKQKTALLCTAHILPEVLM